MSKRKPLPYACAYLVDEAVMAMSQAERQLKPLLEKGDLETVARTAKALNEIHTASNSLSRIKTESPA